MQRVSVVGCPGAGKSVFSAHLHSLTTLPLIYLDTMYHDSKHNYKNDVKGWQKAVGNIVAGQKWIMDGDFVNTFDARFEASDTIIFLDFPTLVCLLHAIRRRLDYRRHPRLEMPRHWKERLPLEFIGYILTYRKNERPKVINSLSKWERDRQILTFRSVKQAEDYLQSISLS